MDREYFITFYLCQKMFAKGNLWNLFQEFLKGKIDKDKKSVLDKWDQIEKLLDDINKELGLDK